MAEENPETDPPTEEPKPTDEPKSE